MISPRGSETYQPSNISIVVLKVLPVMDARSINLKIFMGRFVDSSREACRPRDYERLIVMGFNADVLYSSAGKFTTTGSRILRLSSKLNRRI